MCAFYKLKRVDDHYYIPEGCKVSFRPLGIIKENDLMDAFRFAYAKSFGPEKHREHRTGGDKKRTNGEIFANAFQGKIAEYGMSYIIKDSVGELYRPDIKVYKRGNWDSFDFEVDKKKISVKSTKSFGQLLLLEKGDWNEKGEYIPDLPEISTIYDYFVLIRMNPFCSEILEKEGLLDRVEVDYDYLKNIVLSYEWKYDFAGFITNADFIYLIDNNFIIPEKKYFGNSSTPMDATNIYVKAYDMKKVQQFQRLFAYASKLAKGLNGKDE